MPEGNAVADVNSPELKGSANTHTPAISNIEQAVEIVKSLVAESKDRNLKNARIKSKYDSEKPYQTDRLAADGQSWRTNISTRPLPALVERIVPRFTSALKRMKFLTASALPAEIPGAAKKTEAFRRIVTETCRAREGWEDFLFELVLEDILFGFVGVGWTGRFNWFPTVYSQVGGFLVPSGTRHNAKTCQLVAIKETFLVHELFAAVQDREAAKLAGWDVPQVLESINGALPEARRSQSASSTELETLYVDLKRECSTIGALTATKAVAVWHVFVAEVDGWITHVAYDEANSKMVFWKTKQYPSMTDAMTFFSFQHGNGKLHGSKGTGRELYGMAGILDRARNEAIDRLMLAGKLVVTCPENQINRFRMSVVGSTILIAEGYNINEQKIESNVEDFFKLDAFMTDLLDQNAGSTSPKQLTGERVTKAAVELWASRDEERSDAILDRFLTQFSRCMGTIQRRMCNEDCLEPDAKAAQQKLLKEMNREELDMLSQQPAVSIVEDLSDVQRKQIVLVTSEARGNPLYNQREVERQKVEALVNADFAEQILLPENDPSLTAEQARMQQMELELLQKGQQVPISARDGHEIHLQSLQAATQKLAEGMVEDISAMPVMQAIVAHAEGHIEALKQVDPKKAAPFEQWVKQVAKTMTELIANEQNPQQPPTGTGLPPV